MSWSKIKKAINSRLGKSNFKPLDEIITEGFDSIKNGLESGKIVASTANSIKGVPLEKLRGNDTNFSYYAQHVDNSGGAVNANNYTTEGHFFLINCYNTPEFHGFLDVDLFLGDYFSPNGKKEMVLRQIFRPYDNCRTYIRNASSVSASGSGAVWNWSDWEEIAERLHDDWVTIGTSTGSKSFSDITSGRITSLPDGVYVISWQHNDGTGMASFTHVIEISEIKGRISWNTAYENYNHYLEINRSAIRALYGTVGNLIDDTIYNIKVKRLF